MLGSVYDAGYVKRVRMDDEWAYECYMKTSSGKYAGASPLQGMMNDEFIALIIYRDNELNALILKFVVKANNIDRVIDLWLKLSELNPFSNVFINFEPFDGVKSLAGCISWIMQEKISVLDYKNYRKKTLHL